MLEAITIIIALGGLEIALWWADHKRQQDQLETLEAIWVELALLNEGTSRIYSGESPDSLPHAVLASRPVDLPGTVCQAPTVVTQ
jgi:hypothetical protein